MAFRGHARHAHRKGGLSGGHRHPRTPRSVPIHRTLPPWVRFCTNGQGQCRILVAQAPSEKKEGPAKPFLQGDPGDDTPPAPPPPPCLPTAPPFLVQPPPQQLPNSPPPSVSPPVPNKQMVMALGPPVLYYQPFSTTDPLNWRRLTQLTPKIHLPSPPANLGRHPSTPPYLRQHQGGVCKWLHGQPPAGTLDLEGWAQRAAPENRPDWGFNTQAGWAPWGAVGMLSFTAAGRSQKPPM